MKSILTICLSFLLMGLSAQKIAIVDVASVLDAMPEYKSAQSEVDRVAAEWQQEIAQEYDKIKAMYNKYQAEQVLLSENAKREKEEQIIKKEDEVRALQNLKFGPEGELFKKRQQMVAPIQDKVFATLQTYAGEKGFDLILDKSSATGILFVGPDFDKTEDIKKKLGLN